MDEYSMTDAAITLPALMEATMFAADKHNGQHRKDKAKTPYIHHPIMVTNLLTGVGGITDLETLQAAMLHDTVEDTDTTPEELEQHFGPGVRDLVLEVSDDKDLEKQERKRLQAKHAPHLSPRAKLIKIADKIANLTDLQNSPPSDWPQERIDEYVRWATTVVDGCRGHNESLETRFDELAHALSP